MADTRGRHRATRGFRDESRKSPDYCQLFGALKITGLVHIEQVLSHKCRPITHKDLQLMTHSEWLTINVQHHLPHGRTHRLVKAKPDFPPPAKWVVVSFRWGEEWAPHWSVPNWRRRGGGGWRGDYNQLSKLGWSQSEFMSGKFTSVWLNNKHAFIDLRNSEGSLQTNTCFLFPLISR